MSKDRNHGNDSQSTKAASAPGLLPVDAGPIMTDGNCPPSGQQDVKVTKEVQAYRDKMRSCVNHLLREIRAEVQEVMRLLDEYLEGNVDIKLHYPDLNSSKSDVNDKINKIADDYLPHIPPDDTYSRIFNLWQIVSASSIFEETQRNEFFDNQDDQIRLREISIQKERLSRIRFLIEYATAEERLNNWIKKSRPGYALPFHTIFEDEIGSPEERQKILDLYSLKPQSIKGGLVDPVRGVVLCYPLGGWSRFLRHLMIVLFFLLSFVMVFDAGNSLFVSDSIRQALEVKKMSPELLVLCWAVMLFGIAAHILVTGAKKANVENRQFPLPLRDWEYYLSAKTTMILYKITLSMFIFASMFVLLGGELKLMDAFLIGYSMDSVVELLGASLEKRSAGSLNAIKGKL